MHRLALPDMDAQLFIGGESVAAADGATFTAENPATGTALTEIASAGEADVDAAVRSARDAFTRGVWSGIAPAERKRIMLDFADLLEKNLDDIALLESLEAGKPLTDCQQFDMPDAIACIRWYAESADKVFGKTSPMSDAGFGLIVREAIGVVGAVLPWNFPSATLAWKLGPALVAGNSVVVKPPELASLSTIRTAQLAFEAGIPAGVLNVVPGLGHVAGRAIGLHPDVDVVTFTGSTEVGRAFLRYSADSNLKNIALECGGKCPQIVLPGARFDLELIAEDLAAAAFWNAGQVCTAGSRVLVPNTIRGKLVEVLAAAADSRVMGDPTEAGTTLGPMIERAAQQRTMRYVDEAAATGARVAAGGRVDPDSAGYYVAATVLDDVTPDMPVGREEIFGPVVSVIGYDTVDEALTIANDSEYGLAATVWSSDIDEAITAARRVGAGTVGINGYSEGDISTPFGGYKSSGFGGRDKGLEALEQYTELKTIWLNAR